MKRLPELICANALNLIDVPVLDKYSSYCGVAVVAPQTYKYIITESGVQIETEGPMTELTSWYVGGALDGMTNDGTNLLVLENAVKRIVRYTIDGNTNTNELDMSTLQENFHAINYGVANRNIYAFGIYGGRRRIYFKRKGGISWQYVVVRTQDGTALSAPGGMVIDTNRSYISNLNIIWRGRAYSFHPQSSALAPWLRLPTGFVITAMTSDSTYIYAYERSTKTVIQVDKATKKYKNYFVPNLVDVQGMTLLNNKFYLSDVTTKKVHVFELNVKKLVK